MGKPPACIRENPVIQFSYNSIAVSANQAFDWLNIEGVMGLSLSCIFGIAAFVLIGFLLDREVYFYEGTHLSSRVQA
jgi:ribose/xylose/arabinose/galactoside ABC-type transport system permease subunit